MRRTTPAPPPRRRTLVALVGAALCAVPAIASAKGRVYAVEIRSMAFTAPPASLRVGDVIEWVNADIFRHTATARDGAFDVDLAPRGHARVELKRPGQVAFYCRFHPGMKGQLTIAK